MSQNDGGEHGVGSVGLHLPHFHYSTIPIDMQGYKLPGTSSVLFLNTHDVVGNVAVLEIWVCSLEGNASIYIGNSPVLGE